MTLLSMIQDVADDLGIARPSTVVGSTDQQVRQLLSIANRGGKALARRGDWKALIIQQTFTTSAQAVQTGAIPSDFDRFIDGSMFNRTTNRKVHGPLTAQQWQREQANPSVSVAEDWFRVRGEDMLITPTPPAGETIAYEYVTKNWCESAGGTAQASFQADSDVTILDEELHRLDLIWRWRARKGFDYAEDLANFEREAEKALGRSGGAPVLNLATRPFFKPTMAPNVPDGNFPSS